MDIHQDTPAAFPNGIHGHFIKGWTQGIKKCNDLLCIWVPLYIQAHCTKVQLWQGAENWQHWKRTQGHKLISCVCKTEGPGDAPLIGITQRWVKTNFGMNSSQRSESFLIPGFSTLRFNNPVVGLSWPVVK